jgi:hypothetical protein
LVYRNIRTVDRTIRRPSFLRESTKQPKTLAHYLSTLFPIALLHLPSSETLDHQRRRLPSMRMIHLILS